MQTLETTLTVPFVDLKAQYQSIKEEMDSAIAAVIKETAFIGGPFVRQFEDEFARYCGVAHCVGVANGTDALFIALKAIGVGPGDEVITAANSFIATSEAVTMAGADVVFVDIDPKTSTMDVNQIASKLGPKTKAIIPVHLYGHPADMEPIRQLAAARGVCVVGDAAQAHGALYNGLPIARLADITCFSFYPGKNLGAYGDGGAIVTDREDWAAKARMFGNHGGIKKYEHEFEGVNSRLDDLQAAILSVKLRHLDRWTEDRRRNAQLYTAMLAGTGVTTPSEAPSVKAVYHLYVTRVPADRRDRVLNLLKAAGIGAGIHYPTPLPYLKPYRRLGAADADFPEALRASKEIVSLPMYPELTEEQVRYVSERLRDFVA